MADLVVRENNEGTQGLSIYPSSKALLSWVLENLEIKNCSILELGCGCGALSLALVKAGASKVIACDCEDEVENI